MVSFERLSHPPVVIVANDQEWASRSLESLLGPKGYAVLRVASGRQALDLVRTMHADALILDTRTQDLGAIDICKLLRGDPEIRHTLPIIVTASDGSGRSERVEALAAGAWEYCTQPLDGEVLLLKLATFVRAKRELDRVLDESLIDDVTGLYTLRGLARRAQEIGAQASRKHQPLACIAFAPQREDQPLATGYSPGATTTLVEHVSLVCRKHGRVSDVFGRTGATEFAVLAPGTDDRGAARLLARLQSAVGEAPPADGGREPRSLRLLAGVSSVPDFSESNVDAMDMLLRATDELRRLRAPATEHHV
jgi:PleD family two-component response regulator